MALWTAEKREVIGSTPIPATDKTPVQQGFCCFEVSCLHQRMGCHKQPIDRVCSSLMDSGIGEGKSLKALQKET